VQGAVLGDVTASGDLLDMTHVGDLDVDMVAMTDIDCLIVPDNVASKFIESGGRHRRTCYYGAEDIWQAIR
jgi:hypothetical protein